MQNKDNKQLLRSNRWQFHNLPDKAMNLRHQMTQIVTINQMNMALTINKFNGAAQEKFVGLKGFVRNAM